MKNKVLIVEDEFIVANGLRIILEQAGYKVNGIAASTEEANENMRKCSADIVLLDIRLEGKQSGIDLARKLREENIPFIYLSANSNQTVLEEAKTTEPYGFLVKPFREKDLLVMLDIALYRHQHSLESKLRREELLQTQLSAVSNESLHPGLKLLKIARIIQAYIPFDFISLGSRPMNAAQLQHIGYLRIGFDEYQFIGKQELITIARLSKNEVAAISENSFLPIEISIYNKSKRGQQIDIPALQRILLDSFELQSYISFPVKLNSDTVVHYYLYSRQREIYTKNHISLLNRLGIYFANLAESMIFPEQLSISTANPNQSVNKKHSPPSPVSEFKSIIGSHHLLLAALDLAAQVAPYNTSVLLLGESGTGKEKIAQSIHALSSRKNEIFIKLNCAAIPTTLIESELFGHEKGAFTGAIDKRKGKFEQADGGTLFLDEIGELPLEVQVKLLRVLQEKEIEYVGGNSSIKVNVRIIAATSRNLEKEVADGNFRLDLFYRLNVFPITLPPLRERKTDIESLALFFADKFCKEFNKPFPGISSAMMEALHSYSWPGNIRELENVLEQSIILNDGKSRLELKRNLLTHNQSDGKINIETLQDVKQIQSETERAYIISILKKTKGRIRGADGAAELLKIKPTTLASKIAKLNINRIDFTDSMD